MYFPEGLEDTPWISSICINEYQANGVLLVSKNTLRLERSFMVQKIGDKSCQSNFDKQFWFFLSDLIITVKWMIYSLKIFQDKNSHSKINPIRMLLLSAAMMSRVRVVYLDLFTTQFSEKVLLDT